MWPRHNTQCLCARQVAPGMWPRHNTQCLCARQVAPGMWPRHNTQASRAPQLTAHDGACAAWIDGRCCAGGQHADLGLGAAGQEGENRHQLSWGCPRLAAEHTCMQDSLVLPTLAYQPSSVGAQSSIVVGSEGVTLPAHQWQWLRDGLSASTPRHLTESMLQPIQSRQHSQ